MKLKKYPLKMNDSNQNLNLSKLNQKKFHIDWKDMIRKSTQKKEKTKKKVKNWQNSVCVTWKNQFALDKFYKQTFQNISFFNKKRCLS